MNLAQFSLLASAIYHPRTASALGCFFIVGRMLYSYFYKKPSGAKHPGRQIGALISALAMLGNVCLFLKGFYQTFKKWLKKLNDLHINIELSIPKALT